VPYSKKQSCNLSPTALASRIVVLFPPLIAIPTSLVTVAKTSTLRNAVAIPIHSSTQQPLDDLLHLSPKAAPVQEDKPHKALIVTQQEPKALCLCPATVLAWLLKMLHFKQQD
jgi:hypothetical protein